MPYVVVNSQVIVRNWNVYQQCLPPTSNFVFSEHVILLKKGASVEILQTFFATGTVSNDIEVSFFRRGTFRRASCHMRFRVICYKRSYKYTCPVKGAYNIGGHKLLCGKFRDIPNDNDDSTITNNPKCYVLAFEDKSKPHAKIADWHIAMRVAFGNSLNSPEFLYELGDFGKLNEHLKEYRCLSNNEETPCRVIAQCQPGFVAIDLICRKPTILAIQVVGVKESFGMLDRSLLAITQLIHEDKTSFVQLDKNRFQNRVETIYGSHYKALTNFSPIKQIDILVQNEKNLSLSDLLVQGFHDILRNSSDMVTVKKITICFVIEKETYHPRMLVCDRFLSNAESLKLDGHFSVLGSRIPDPFLGLPFAKEGNMTALKIQLNYMTLVVLIIVHVLYF